MSINQRQFDQLTEMGISLWQHKATSFKATSFKNNSSNKDIVKQAENYIAQNDTSLSDLTKQMIFIDILQSFGISIGEISYKKDHLDLGLFNWYFSLKDHIKPAIYCANNNLFSPSITLISQSPELKKQLWQTITKYLL